jgi:opine dehydrogenase
VTEVAVLGGGNGSHAAVVDLTLKGFDVAWWRRPGSEFANGGAIAYTGTFGDGVVTPSLVTHSLTEAVTASELVVVPLPATAQESLLDALAPLLETRHVVALLPGTFGTWLGALRRPDVAFVEVGTLPYLARLTGPGEVAVPVAASRLPTGSIPGAGPVADLAHELFSAAYPCAVRVTDGLDAALTNWGPVIHPPLVTHNLGAIESLGDRFDIHREGTSPSVRRAVLALDAERIGLREALAIPGEHWPIRTHYERSPLGMYPPDAHDRLVASNLWRESLDLDHRYLWEDVVCGLVLNATIGRLAGHPMPQSEAILQLLGVALGFDPVARGRSAGSIGVTDLDEVRRCVTDGFV